MELAARVAVALDVDQVDELSGGHQSRVFRITGRDGRVAVAKVLDASMVNRRELDLRLDVTAALADLDPRVCRPLEVGDGRVVELSFVGGVEYYVTCFEFALGSAPDPANPADATGMGVELAQLHVSMSQLPKTLLPIVSALRNVPANKLPAAAGHHLLHGDFSASNLRQTSGIFRIFDLDDCGYGPPAFDIANALYMVLFDSATNGPAETYGTFRQSFLDGYTSSGLSLSEASLERFIDLRVRALSSWLSDLESAPIGIRTAAPAWRATLRTFVENYETTYT